MRKSCTIGFALAMALASTNRGLAQDRLTKVKQDRANLENDKTWVYNDIEKGFAEAKRTKKPLFVVLRCIPCEACSEFDKELLDQDNEVRDLFDQFVCVRIVQGNHLDLSLFQFDYDQSFHAMFLNADKTIYARYGTRSARKEPEDMTLPGLRKTMLAILELHKQYPSNKQQLAGKQPHPAEIKYPEQLPTLAGKYTPKLDDAAPVKSCLHCHQIRDAERDTLRTAGKTIPEQVLFPYPLPDALGLRMNPDEIATIAGVEPESIAERVDLKPGDVIVEFDGQPILSTADIQWVLHHAGETDSLPIKFRRGPVTHGATIELSHYWRRLSDISFRPTTWNLRRYVTGGMLLQDLSDEERKRRGIGKDSLALLVKHVGMYGDHAAAHRAGFKKDDVIVAVEGQSPRWSESLFIANLIAKKKGEKVETTLLRGKERLELAFPIQ